MLTAQQIASNTKNKFDKPILVLDFDGVLHTYSSGWQGLHVAVNDPVPGAMEFIREAMEHFAVHILSARSASPTGRCVMKSWLLHHYAKVFNLTFDEATEELKAIQWPRTKPHAHYSLDDRAVTFVGKWPTVEDIKNFKPWNR